MAWLFLAAAIASEVTGTLALRESEGLSRLWPSLVVLIGYGVAFLLLAQALRSIGVGTAYATWSGMGTVGVALAGWWLFGERLSPPALVGITLVIAGVAILNLAGPAHT